MIGKLGTWCCKRRLKVVTGKFDPSLRGSLDRFGVEAELILKGLDPVDGGLGGVPNLTGDSSSSLDSTSLSDCDLCKSFSSRDSISSRQSFTSFSSSADVKPSLCRKAGVRKSENSICVSVSSSVLDWLDLMARKMAAEATDLCGCRNPNFDDRKTSVAASSAFVSSSFLKSSFNLRLSLSEVSTCESISALTVLLVLLVSLVLIVWLWMSRMSGSR